MEPIERKVSYIIGFRQSSVDRLLGLKFVLTWLYYHFPELEVIIVEQDNESKLTLELPPNCTKYFIYNPGLYNRSWAFNYGVRHTDKDLLAFADSDMFITKEDYIASFKANEVFEVVNPNGLHAVNVENAKVENLSFVEKDRKYLWTIAAGLILMQRNSFYKIGGWDERFEGWGGEDNEMSHVILNSLSVKGYDFNIYHIDHNRSALDGNNQPQYLKNHSLSEEVTSLVGEGLVRYINNRKQRVIGRPEKYNLAANAEDQKTPHFVLAVTTYNRKLFLKEFLESWEKTKTGNVTWSLIIADDGSTDGTIDYINKYSTADTEVILIQNNRNGISYQFNTIAYELSKMVFDVCFKCDDDILFKKSGWDLLYYEIIIRTGYQHLCFYDAALSPKDNLPTPIIKGDLICHCTSGNIQGCFFTLTPEIISKVGYMDIQSFGFRGLEHIDYTFRCCRLGFNVLDSPFDIRNSNDFIVARKDDYVPSIPDNIALIFYDDESIQNKKNIVNQTRTFIPRNEIDLDNKELKILENSVAKEDASDRRTAGTLRKEQRKTPSKFYLKGVGSPWPLPFQVLKLINKNFYEITDPTLITNQGISRFVFSIYKKFFNFCFYNRLYFVIRIHNRIADICLKTGFSLKNIDNK